MLKKPDGQNKNDDRLKSTGNLFYKLMLNKCLLETLVMFDVIPQ